MTGSNGRPTGGNLRRRAGTPAAVMVVLLIAVPLLSSLALSTRRVAELDQQRRDLAVLRSASDRLVHVVTARALLAEEQNAVGLGRGIEQLGLNPALASMVLGFDVSAEPETISVVVDEHLEAISPGLSRREPFRDRLALIDRDFDDLSRAYDRADGHLSTIELTEEARLNGAVAALGIEELDPSLKRLVAVTDAYRRMARMASSFAGLVTPSLSYNTPEEQLRSLYGHRFAYEAAMEQLGADGRPVPADDPEVAVLLDFFDEVLADVAGEGTGDITLFDDGVDITDIDPDTVQWLGSLNSVADLHRASVSQVAEETRVAIEEADGEAAAGIRRSLVLALVLVVVTLGSVVAATLAIVRPLRRLARGAQQLGAGEAGVQVSVGGVRELQEAIRALNEASTSIAVAQERTQALADRAFAPGGAGERVVEEGLEARMAASFDVLESLMAEREEDRARFEHEAFHDPLTGLLNRRGLRRRLDDLLEQMSGEGDEWVVLYLDLDGFKAVNDTYGHDAGDAVLTAMAKRLGVLTPVGSTVARMGGDEFIVVVADDGDDLGQRVGSAIKAGIARPITDVDGGRVLSVGASVGFCAGAADGDGLERLITAADAAAYFAKAHGAPEPVAHTSAVAEWLARRSAAGYSS